MSFDWYRRAHTAIAQGSLTNSKRVETFIKGVTPTHATHGEGAYLYGVDGKKYLDYCCANGTNLFGYGHPLIKKAIAEQLNRGWLYSLGSTMEVECAELVKDRVPFVKKVRFLKSGTEACMAAIRIARAHHGVSYEHENLYGLLGNKDFTRVPSGWIEKGWLSQKLQSLCEGISNAARDYGNQEVGAVEICPLTEGKTDRGEALPKETRENQISRQRQGLFSRAAAAFKEALRSMWVSQFSGTPPRLLETSGRDLALSQASRGGPRVLILSDGYHGHADAFIGLSEPRCGVIPDPYMLPLNGNEDLIPIAAAVIIEPIMTDHSEARRQWLLDLVNRCRIHKTIVIFDEIITGFRWPRLTFSAQSGIHPDIVLLGKACASGLPLAIVGLAEHIGDDKEWFVSGTYAGELLSLAVMKQTLHMLHNKYKLEDLWKDGEAFIEEFNTLYPNKLKIEGYPTRGVFTGDQHIKALFFQESHKAGILFGPSWFYGFQHLGSRAQTISVCRDIMQRIRTNQVMLEGEAPASPFAERMRISA